MTTETTEARTLTRIGEVLVDEDTGEIVEFPAGADRFEYLQVQHLFAKQQEEEWLEAKRAYARLLGRMLDEQQVRALGTPSGRTRAVAGSTIRKSEARAVRDAQRVELLTAEQAARLLIEAAGALDVEVVERLIKEFAGEDEAYAGRLRLVLIGETPRAGYVTTSAPRVGAPKVEREEAAS